MSSRLSPFVTGLIATAVFVVAIVWASAWISDNGTERHVEQPETTSDFGEHGVFRPVPAVPEYPAAKVLLGRTLFHDKRLSRDNTIACASCHDLSKGGVDGRMFSVGVNGAVGSVNAPTVLNAALNFAQFWDGRAASLEEQVAGPVNNPVEMASNWPEVIAKLNADPAIRRQFSDIYRGEITASNIADAIATFERTLLTTDSPFDRYLRGDEAAINARAKEGYDLFLSLGCASCHQGVNAGGNMYQKFGVMADYLGSNQRKRPISDADQGRFNVTKRDEDRHVFKVPGLRNVALTAPYFHDGSANTLEKAVEVMGKFQLGRELSSDEVGSIVAFLNSLTGTVPAVASP